VRITCNLYCDHVEKQREIERFWLDTLRLPESSLHVSTVNRHSHWSSLKRRNKLPYGTCRLVLNNTRIVQTIFGSIQECGGFAREEWLDLHH